LCSLPLALGSHWGEDGFFRIIRGTNSMNIEWNCGWGVPSFEPAAEAGL